MTLLRGGRGRLLLALVVVVAVALAVVVVRHERSQGVGLAARATVSVSSAAVGTSPTEVVSSDHAGDPERGWRSDGEADGAWLQLAWRHPVKLRRVVIERNPLDQPGILSGFLSFSDGSALQVRLSTTSRTTVVPITSRQVDLLRFTVSGVTDGASSVALTHFAVDDDQHADDVATDAPADGDVAGSAALSSSTASDDGALEPLVDGDAATGGSGQTWTVDAPTGAWVELDWKQPRELTTISVAGSPSQATLASGTLEFSDGSRLTLGAVLADPARPTVVSFMPRVTTSVRLTFDTLSGSGPLTLAEISALQRGAPARGPVGASTAAADQPTPACQPPSVRTTDTIGMVVECPTQGAEVTGSVTALVDLGPSYTSATATVWPSDAAASTPAAVRATPTSDGAASFVLDVSGLPPGPFTIRFAAAGAGQPDVVSYFGLDRSSSDTGTASDDGSSSAADTSDSTRSQTRGRSLVYDDEFSGPLSVTATGADADYASTKPEQTGVSDFGDALFADPALGLGNVTSVDHSYLRIAVQPKPDSLADAAGRTHIGGLLASARPGGSGFSAQYGYFEARMLAPASPGTWPAFWMLPSANLVAPLPAVAEIDAVEMYGHDPTGACETTHQYADGKDGGVARCGMRWDTDREALAWHTYGVSVGPALISYFIDGKLVATAPQVQGGQEPLFFLLDLALGGGWPVHLARVQDRAELYVDYVRVYV